MYVHVLNVHVLRRRQVRELDFFFSTDIFNVIGYKFPLWLTILFSGILFYNVTTLQSVIFLFGEKKHGLLNMKTKYVLLTSTLGALAVSVIL